MKLLCVLPSEISVGSETFPTETLKTVHVSLRDKNDFGGLSPIIFQASIISSYICVYILFVQRTLNSLSLNGKLFRKLCQ